jgi:hypothetical protein
MAAELLDIAHGADEGVRADVGEVSELSCEVTAHFIQVGNGALGEAWSDCRGLEDD